MGNTLVTGYTESSGWVSGGFDTSHNGNSDVFVAKLSSMGDHLWSTYLGGINRDGAADIVVDGKGNALLTGNTESTGWVTGGFDTSHNGNRDAIVAKLSSTGGHLWSTYLGGSSADYGQGVAVDGMGDVLVTGYTESSGWVSGGFDSSYNGGFDAFVARITGNEPPEADAGGPYFVDEGSSVQLDASGSSDPEQPTASLTYEWDLDGDTVFGEVGAGALRGDEVGVNPAFSAAGLDGPSSVTVSLLVTDNGGLSDTVPAIINIVNVAPTLLTSGGSMVDEGSVYTLNLSSSDPGDDTVQFWTVDWDDGIIEILPGNPSSATHTYADGTKTYQTTATATDEDGTFAAKSLQTAINNGQLDLTFEDDGLVVETLSGGAGGRGVVVQPDGKNLVATQIRGAASPSDTDFALLRYDVDGSLDTTFGGGDGIATTSFSLRDRGEDVALLSNGNIVVAGTEGDGLFADNFAIAIFDTNGNLVTQTSSDLGGSIDRAFGVAVDSSDNIYVAGRVRTGSADDAAVARYTSAGALDTAWGSLGMTLVDYFANFDVFNDVAIAPSGAIVAAGSAFPAAFGTNVSAVARINAADGTLDTTFDSNGKQTTSLVQSARGVAVQGDNKVVIAGDRVNNFALFRFDDDGSADGTFGSGGQAIVSFGTTSSATSVVLDAAGNIVVGGGVGSATDQDFGLTRLDNSGSLDTSFGTAGLVRTDFTAAPFVSNERVFEIAIASNGQIVASGQFSNVTTSTSVALARYGSPGGISDEPLNVLVKNVAPTITDLSNSAEDCGDTAAHEPIDVSVDFTDPGFDNPAGGTTEDFATSEIDWGDGTVDTIPDITVNETPGSPVDLTTGTVSGSHAYTSGGIYTITVTIRDDDGGEAVTTSTAFVSGIHVDSATGELQIVGTRDADHVTINRLGNGLLKVHADFLPSGNFVTVDTNATPVNKIIAYLCAGDDHMTIAGNIDIQAIIHGGAGNDHLNAGGGPTVLLGDAGADMLVGGTGHGIFIGGTGEDRLVGGKDEDVLVGGSTSDDSDDDALMDVLAAWTTADSNDAGVVAIKTLLSVQDDEEEDLLTGGSDRDLFYDGLGDILTDVKTKKEPETVL